MSRIIIEKDIDIPMRDGCVLKADLYRPEGPEKLPVLLNRTPYDKSFPPITLNTLDVVRAARAGYNVVVQDCRGHVRLARDLSLLRRRGARRLRHHRVPRAPALGRRQGRHLRRVLHGRDAMARRDPASAEPQSDGAVDHGQRLPRRMGLPGRRVRAVLQRELADDHAGPQPPDARARGQSQGGRGVERGDGQYRRDARADGVRAARRVSALSHRRAVLLRLARASLLRRLLARDLYRGAARQDRRAGAQRRRMARHLHGRDAAQLSRDARARRLRRRSRGPAPAGRPVASRGAVLEPGGPGRLRLSLRPGGD